MGTLSLSTSSKDTREDTGDQQTSTASTMSSILGRTALRSRAPLVARSVGQQRLLHVDNVVGDVRTRPRILQAKI